MWVQIWFNTVFTGGHCKQLLTRIFPQHKIAVAASIINEAGVVVNPQRLRCLILVVKKIWFDIWLDIYIDALQFYCLYPLYKSDNLIRLSFNYSNDRRCACYQAFYYSDIWVESLHCQIWWKEGESARIKRFSRRYHIHYESLWEYKKNTATTFRNTTSNN